MRVHNPKKLQRLQVTMAIKDKMARIREWAEESATAEMRRSLYCTSVLADDNAPAVYGGSAPVSKVSCRCKGRNSSRKEDIQSQYARILYIYMHPCGYMTVDEYIPKYTLCKNACRMHTCKNSKPKCILLHTWLCSDLRGFTFGDLQVLLCSCCIIQTSNPAPARKGT